MTTLTRRELIAASASLPLAAAPPLDAAAAVEVGVNGTLLLKGSRATERGRVTVDDVAGGVALVGLAGLVGTIADDGELGLAFDFVPGFDLGVQLWRYAPWKAWTRPLAVERPADLKPDDIQFLYWRRADGGFVAAVPLSGHSLRTTLGQIGGCFAARATALASAPLPEAMPLLAIGHGDDPHAVIAATYRAALAAMGRREEAAAKTPPEPLTWLGWNSWNASNLGNKLDERLIIDAATTLHAAGAPVRWMLIDDGWFDHRDGRLRSFTPNPERFPRGFGPMVETLKRDHGIRHVGAWLALDGYWHGIDPASPVGRRYAADLFNWTEPSNLGDPVSPLRTDSFVRPDRPAMAHFYDEQHATLAREGIRFVKVDNQLVVERMAKGNFPIWQLASAMHGAANAAAERHFGGAMTNCMDLTADAYFNFGRTPVARAVEDYFPYDPAETYDLEKGNAAAHVLQALHNALYVSQVAIPDFDMFETTNPNARLHAVARAANNAPIYVTDLPGHHDVALLRSMTLADGRSLRADRPLLPCADCLFQLQAPRPFKAFSGVGEVGLLMIANLADANQVAGSWSGADVSGFGNRAIVAYEHLSGRMVVLAAEEAASVSLPRFGVELWSLHDLAGGFAAFGLAGKINGPATVSGLRRDVSNYHVRLSEGGRFTAYLRREPKSVTKGSRALPWIWTGGFLSVVMPDSVSAAEITIKT